MKTYHFKIFKYLWRGISSVLFMWGIGVLVSWGMIWLTKIDSIWYFAALYIAVPWAMAGVIGADIDDRKKRIIRNKELLRKTVEEYMERDDNVAYKV